MPSKMLCYQVVSQSSELDSRFTFFQRDMSKHLVMGESLAAQLLVKPT